MNYEVTPLKKGIVRISAHKIMPKNYLERYGIISIPEKDSTADAVVCENKITLPDGRVLEFKIRPETDDDFWGDEIRYQIDKFQDKIPTRINIEGRPEDTLMQWYESLNGKDSKKKFGISFKIDDNEQFYGLGEAGREDIKVSVSMTTREKREGEIDGTHYYFVSREYFEKKVSEDKMLENAEYNGNLYGTPKAPVDEMLKSGKAVILEIEVQGAEKIRKLYPDVISIFLMPPSMRVLEERLRGRGTDDEETINHRLVIAREEIKRAPEYDYVVINDTIENAVAGIETIINAERKKTFRNKKILSEVINNV